MEEKLLLAIVISNVTISSKTNYFFKMINTNTKEMEKSLVRFIQNSMQKQSTNSLSNIKSRKCIQNND